MDTTKTTMNNTIMVTPTITAHQWIDQQGEASSHHKVETDTTRHLSMQCPIESQGRDLQEEVVPHQEDQQEVDTLENLEAHLKSLKADHP